MSYWRVDDSVRVGETKVSIPSENGLEYSPGQKIQLYVDPSTKFMDGRETYLDFNFQIKLPSGKKPTRLQLDKVGGNILFSGIRIYDGSRGQLLEEINAYDTMCAVKYDYDKDANTENMRALLEGGAFYTPDNRGEHGTTKTPMGNTTHSPYFKKTSGNQTTIFSDSDFLKAKLCIPLQTGIFANSTTIFPVMMTNGLYIELDLNPAEKVLKQLESVQRNRRTEYAPFFHSRNGSNASSNVLGGIPNGSTLTSFYVRRDNNLGGPDSVSRFPFVVGETFGFCRSDNNGSTENFDDELEISEINLSNGADGGAGLIEVVLKDPRDKTTSSMTTTNEDIRYIMYSRAVEDETSYDVSYTISNVNLIVSQVRLDPGYESGMVQKVREGKAIEFDIMSATNYKHSILASDRQTTFQIFAQNSRAKSLLVVPQDSSVYNSADQISGKSGYVIKGSDNSNASSLSKDAQDTCLQANRSGYTGICDFLSSVQYTMNGKRVPSREISTKKIATRNSIDQFHIYELEKCLDNSGIQPKSFTAFMENFVFGRGFSAGGQKGAMDLRGKDLAVILKYLESDAPTKPKLFNSFVFHLRRLMIRDGAVDIIV
jgi:hypothetical protein